MKSLLSLHSVNTCYKKLVFTSVGNAKSSPFYRMPGTLDVKRKMSSADSNEFFDDSRILSDDRSKPVKSSGYYSATTKKESTSSSGRNNNWNKRSSSFSNQRNDIRSREDVGFSERPMYKPRPSNREEYTRIEGEGFNGDYLYGIFPIRMALREKKRKFYELLVQDGMDLSNKKDNTGCHEIFDMVKSLNIPQRELTKHELNLLSDSRPHQGFVLKSSKLEFENMKSLPPTDKFQCYLALDEVWDPQNFGALVRTCHFLGVDGIIVCLKNSAPASPTVSKASSGALESTNIYSTSNMVKFLDESVKNGWQVVGTALEGNVIKLNDLPLDKPTIVVLGNEGHGIRTNVLMKCTQLVRIGDAVTKSSDVDSLNVSVTGGIILHHVLQNKGA